MKIDFSPPDITKEEIDEVVQVLESGWITTGPKTKQFEEVISRACQTNKAAAMNSATACLEMTLRLLGIGEGDEVITSAYTYSASASVIHHVGAKVVLVDTEEGSFHLDVQAVEKAMNEKTKAIIPVDVGGVMVDYETLMDISKNQKHLFRPNSPIQETIGRVAVIADAAHSFGAKRRGIPSGSMADFTAFSFHAVKNLTTAEGGAVTWRSIDGWDDEIYRQFMLLSLHGQSKDAMNKLKVGSWEYDIEGLYFKCNMTDMMAALGLVQLKRYPNLLQRRKEIVTLYEEGLQGTQTERWEHEGEDFESSRHLYMVNLTGRTESFRNQVIEKMAKQGIATNVHYKPLPMHSAYKKLGFRIEDFPNAFKMYENEISLPLHTCLKDEQVSYVIDALKKCMAE